jgi:hypothetical protein
VRAVLCIAGILVAAVGAQRTARPTLRFRQSLHNLMIAHRDNEPRRRELARERLGLIRRRSLRSRRFGSARPCRRWASGSYQAPNTKETPSTKLQNDRPLLLDKGSAAVAGRPSCREPLWELKLGASLELGAWSLELGALPLFQGPNITVDLEARSLLA